MGMFGGATALLGPSILLHADLDGVSEWHFILPCAAHAVNTLLILMQCIIRER